MRRTPPLTDDDKKAIMDAVHLRVTLTNKALAAAIGCSESTVSNFIKDARRAGLVQHGKPRGDRWGVRRREAAQTV